MPEFLTLFPPDEARNLLLSHLSQQPTIASETIAVAFSLGRVLAEDIVAPHPLPDFRRATVDGYAVRAADTNGGSDSLPAYLNLVGEVPMGDTPAFAVGLGQCALIHTGGMLPNGTDAVVMLEYTQQIGEDKHLSRDRRLPVPTVPTNAVARTEIEIFRAAADGENVIRIGEDVAQGQVVQAKGRVL